MRQQAETEPALGFRGTAGGQLDLGEPAGIADRGRIGTVQGEQRQAGGFGIRRRFIIEYARAAVIPAAITAGMLEEEGGAQLEPPA